MNREVHIVEHARERRPFIAIVIPTFGRVSIRWAMAALVQLRQPLNHPWVHMIVQGLEVGLARNEGVARALALENDERVCSHVLFIDDDVIPHPDAVLKLLERGRPIVSGLYYLKASVPTPLILHDADAGVSRSWRPGDLVECWAHGMGLTLIETDVFRRLRDETDLGMDARGFPAWFRTTKDAAIVAPNGEFANRRVDNMTEDVHFLRQAATLGYRPAVDTSPQAFAFHWADGEQRAYPLKQWTEFTTKGTITWETDDGPVTWGAAA